MKNRKEEVTFIFGTGFIFLLIGLFTYGLIFNFIAPSMFGKNYDKGALASMIGWSATLFIGYAGYILIDKWKDQEHKKIIRDNADKSINYLNKFTTMALYQSNIKDLSITDFDSYQSAYYDTFLSLNILYELTKEPDLKQIQDLFKDTYLETNNIRMLIIDNIISFEEGKNEIRELIFSTGIIHKKISYFMNINNI
ncbi:hypothetical protein ACG92Y_04440 [Acinetobacter ursingii]|uniref:hypothetical protein n=1 Tax=Acinetobacter ursingii TaxID=108980 RepID=UPI003AF5A3F5